MALLFLKDIELAFGAHTLLDGVQFQIEPQERVCIVGRNGEGKSTLLKVIEGQLLPDDGTRIVQDGVKIAKLQQEVPHDLSGTVFEVVSQGLGAIGERLKQFYQLTQQISVDPSDSILSELNEIQHQLDAENGWDLNQRVDTTLSKLSLPADREFASLSGGMKRRVLLAQALVQSPDILLLDEPTNHLDIPAIDWLETFLKGLSCSLVFITHDRMFLQSLATRIVELDRGTLLNWECDYVTYLQRREAYLEAEAKSRSEFDKKLAQEEAWIRQGIKARRTRNEGRVRALERMRSEFRDRRHLQGSAQLTANQADASGKQVIKVTDLSFSWPDQTVVHNFSTLIQRGDKVGIIGPNGCGKSTLLKLLLGQLEANAGQVQLGTQLKIAYFDQHRAQLDENKPVIESVLEESDHVEINGQRKHIMGYLQDFLFSPERARQPVKALSGGERNRLLLARVFAKPANLLVLDEPTNDLDIETLELLEELLLNVSATVLIVSHDRAFLNSVTTSCLAFDAPGELHHYVGGYDDWVRQSPTGGLFQAPLPSVSASTESPKLASKEKTERPPEASKQSDSSTVSKPDRQKTQKLSYKEQREYDALPEKIETLEAKLEAMTDEISQPDFYQTPDFQSTLDAMKACETALEECFERWELLETKVQAFENSSS